MQRQASQQRYEAALRGVLGADQARQVAEDPAAAWLWRTLREAEAAGLDGPATLCRAAQSGSLDDADSVAKVLDWRIRQQTAGMPPLAARPWTDQVPRTGDADADRYARELAEAMDDRVRRLGEHAAAHPPAWAQVLGAVPDHPVDRAEWEHKASLIAAYREMWGYAHPHQPIGPRPGDHSPEARAMWQAAAEALGHVPGQMREHSDGQLWAWRSAWHREMAWAPDYKGDELALVRGEIRRAQIDADRARRNAEAAATADARQRLMQLATVRAGWEQAVRDLAARLAEAQAGYDAWEQATAPTRDRAVAADAELRRRHPDTWIEPLRAQHPEQGGLVLPQTRTQPGPRGNRHRPTRRSLMLPRPCHSGPARPRLCRSPTPRLLPRRPARATTRHRIRPRRRSGAPGRPPASRRTGGPAPRQRHAPSR